MLAAGFKHGARELRFRQVISCNLFVSQREGVRLVKPRASFLTSTRGPPRFEFPQLRAGALAAATEVPLA